MKSLLSIINEKDTHIKALEEKLQDLGGSYFPRKYKDALESFDEEKWRDEQRKLVARGKESGWEVFERWGELGEEEVGDWEAVVEGLGSWDQNELVISHWTKVFIVGESMEKTD